MNLLTTNALRKLFMSIKPPIKLDRKVNSAAPKGRRRGYQGTGGGSGNIYERERVRLQSRARKSSAERLVRLAEENCEIIAAIRTIRRSNAERSQNLAETRARKSRARARESSTEMAVLLVDEEKGSMDILLHGRDDQLKRVSELHRAYDSLQYLLMFVSGDDYCLTIPQQNAARNKSLLKTVDGIIEETYQAACQAREKWSFGKTSRKRDLDELTMSDRAHVEAVKRIFKYTENSGHTMEGSRRPIYRTLATNKTEKKSCTRSCHDALDLLKNGEKLKREPRSKLSVEPELKLVRDRTRNKEQYRDQN
ncbi:hypothetical protein EVAR_10617_1 [Eumeta japonica]|uniref:Uncharacterized protein n=1 Tax=Eumeta variegata TaxID=151549 RepID=A0A4C1U214_EUMVA|nr:hypothetical protein EVAR_10617_1 [Eumeta japonica]